jgi:hypothetical protein
MATMHVNESKLVLRYNDKLGSFTFKSFVPDAANDDLYAVARILNGFQENQAEKIVKVTTNIIV